MVAPQRVNLALSVIVGLEQTLEGEPAKDTAVTRLKEDLLDPSFRIGKEIDVEKFLKEFDKVKQDSKKAERKYKSKRKEEVVSKGYRRFERGEPARLLAIEVAIQHLEDALDEERVLLGKDEFEERIRDEVAQAFKKEELKQEGWRTARWRDPFGLGPIRGPFIGLGPVSA